MRERWRDVARIRGVLYSVLYPLIPLTDTSLSIEEA